MKGKLANIPASARRAVSRDRRLVLEKVSIRLPLMDLEPAKEMAKRKRIPKILTHLGLWAATL